ncbi:MAG: hypothetical protein WKF37_14670 [Bryobacteraceae bacterium]
MNKFFQHELEPAVSETGFFRGMRSGAIFKEVYAQVDDTLKKFQGRRIFFGPRMQWAYAAFKLPSPLGQPPWWHPGVSFPIAETGKYISAFTQMQNDVLIFLKNDTSYYPPELVKAVQENYSEDQLSQLTVYQRSGPGLTKVSVKAQAPPIAGDFTSNDGTGSIKGTLTTSVTIDVPATPAHGNFGTRVSLPGVAPSDALLISPTGYAGTWGIYYDSPDTVTELQQHQEHTIHLR